MTKTLIFTATYNESKNIKELITKIFELKNDLNLLIIDDNSPDRTYEIIESHNEINKKLFLIKRKKKLGLDTAHKHAYDFAKKNGYEKLITLDADLSHNPNEIPTFINLLDNFDFVIGSRYSKGAKNNQPLMRFLISYFGNKLIKILLRSSLNEYTTSYRGFNIIKLKNFDMNLVKASGYSFFMGTIHYLKLANANMIETPIVFNDRVYGVSKIPKIEIFRTFFNLIKYSLKK